mmetsp:Transcript_16126/g.11370  ORF Transcript_16126/g.11370 Transcript_16126/m.11370 type:complete len:100 (-) Transcript_16126:2061-2360(-)
MTEDALHGKLKYMSMLQKVSNKQCKTIEITLEDIQDHFNNNRDAGFLERVKCNTDRYIKLFCMVIDKEMPVPSINFREEDKTTFDVIMEQRRFNLQNTI